VGGRIKKMLHRLELLEKIDDDDRETILKVVDNYLTTAQLQTTHKRLKQKA
jgi:flagellar motor switch protein FliG